MSQQQRRAAHRIVGTGPLTPMTRRQYLLMRLLLDGHDPNLVREAVSSTAMEHPEWDMDEVRPWAEWEGSSLNEPPSATP